jgi:cyclopropane fatty-acyl-phospholipid synthase-like methyltransferase
VKDFYDAYYSAVEHSQAYHTFCIRVFGKDLCQHGFANLQQLELLLEVIKLNTEQIVLDLGCGNGMITEYISDCTGAHLTGLDYIPRAISQVQRRTSAKSDRLAFVIGDINKLNYPKNTFDVILSIDSMYFSKDLSATLQELKALLKPNGKMAIFFSHGREPWVPKDKFLKDTLPPDKTPLAIALESNGLLYQTWDLTPQDYELAQRRKEVLAELKLQFENEGTQFLYEDRMGDAEGISQAIEEGLHARYLYYVQPAIPN